VTVVRITTEALDRMEAQYCDLKRRYILLLTLYAVTNRQRLEAEEEANRLWGLAQGSWLPLVEEIDHLYQVLSETG
jgi:hypothetical protein